MKTPILLAVASLIGLSSSSALTPEVIIDSLTLTSSEQLIATFSDNGTGEVEDFSLEASPDLKVWNPISTAVFTPNGVGKWIVTAPVDLMQSSAFFRVLKDGVALTATFSVPTLTVKEGDGAAGITVTFNQPFTGTLRYEIDGTPASQTLTNANSARINVPTNGALDDNEPGQLRTITLNLELEGAGGVTSYTLGLNSSSTIVIEDNDVLWSGVIKLPNKGGEVGIRILRTEQDGVMTTCFKTDKGGIIPTAPPGTNWLFNNFEIDEENDLFTAGVSGVNIPAESTFYNADTQLDIVFAAAGDANVTASKIEGEFILSTTVTSSPHLDVPELTGTFVLIRQVGRAGSTPAPTAP